jgi:hypothetical protein
MLSLSPIYQYGILAQWGPGSLATKLGFSHAYYGATRHAITVGFLSLMIMGVAAKIVPTLNGVSPNALTPLWAPFVLVNLGCALRVTGQTLTDFTPAAFGVAGASGLLEVMGLGLWGVHLWRVMAGKVRLTHQAAARAEYDPSTPIRGELTVAVALDAHPELLDTFVAFGFTALVNPRFRASLARVVTIDRACRRMGVDCNQFLCELNRRTEQTRCASLPFVPLQAVQLNVKRN